MFSGGLRVCEGGARLKRRRLKVEGKLSTGRMGRLERSSSIPRWKGGNRLGGSTGAGGRREVGEVGEFGPVRSQGEQQRVGEILRGAGSQ